MAYMRQGEKLIQLNTSVEDYMDPKKYDLNKDKDNDDNRVDTSKTGGFSIFKKGNNYFISLSTETFFRERWGSVLKSSLKLWLMERTSLETIIIDSFDGVLQGYDNVYDLEDASPSITIFMYTKAKTVFRLNNLVGNMTCLLALTCDRVEVGEKGGLFLLPFIKMNHSEFTKSLRPFIEHIYKIGHKKNIITTDELQRLLSRSDVVHVTKDQLIERGVAVTPSLG